MKKIILTEGEMNNIEFRDLNLSTLLQIHDGNSGKHQKGEIYLRINKDAELIADFSVDQNDSTKDYYTQIYQNYFFTFGKEHKSLLIEKAKFGKAFTLSSVGVGIIGDKDAAVEVRITDYMMEWGYDAPPNDSTRQYFSNVQYTVQVKAGDLVESFSFYSAEIKDDFTFDDENFRIQIMSDQYKDSYCLLEMKVVQAP